MSNPVLTSATPKDIWSAEAYNKNASFVYSQAFTSPVLDLLNAQPGERILDLGCGTGELDVQIARIVGKEGFVLATDASQNMIEKARVVCKGVDNLELRVVDASKLPHELVPTPDRFRVSPEKRQFDAVFSNAALHWILAQTSSPLSVFQAVHSLLTPRSPAQDSSNGVITPDQGGRFAAEMGGYLNIIGVRSAIWRALKRRGYDARALDPWYFPGVEETTKLLQDAGFEVRHCALVPRITVLPGDLVGWLRTFFLGSFISQVNVEGVSGEGAEARKVQIAEEIMAEVQEECEIDCKDKFTGKWSVMYVRLRFEAVAKPDILSQVENIW